MAGYSLVEEEIGEGGPRRSATASSQPTPKLREESFGALVTLFVAKTITVDGQT
jgi:hypothetical protein